MKYKLTTKIPTWWQLEAAQFLISRPSSLLATMTGTGKSIMQIMSFFALLHMKKVNKVLFVGTKTSVGELHSEILESTNQKPFIVDSQETMDEFFNNDIEICLIQYEVFKKLNPEYTRKQILQHKTLISLDEVHKLKNPSSGIGELFRFYRPAFTYLIGATATPFTSSVNDLFNVIDFIKPGLLGTKGDFWNNYVDFDLVPIKKVKCIYCNREAFAVNCPECGARMPKNARPNIRGYKNEEILQKRLSTVQYSFFPEMDVRFIKKDCYCLERYDDYIDAAEGVYGKEDKKDKKQHSARLIDLQYIVNESPEKLKEMHDLISTLNHGVIYCAFHHSVDLVSKYLDKAGFKYETISGNTSKKKRTEIKKWFTENPDGKFVIITSAGSQSINLHVTDNFIFYDIPFSVGDFLQAIGRIVRIFSKYKTFKIFFIIAKDTIDEYKYNYVSVNKDFLLKIYDNRFVPKGTIESYNTHLISSMRKAFLWRKKNGL